MNAHHSDWYMGTSTEMRPTPRPAITRPTMKRGSAVDAVCIATPTEKTRAAKMMPNLRPRKSAAGAPRSAPKKVPTERMETTRDCWEVVIMHPVGWLTRSVVVEPNVQSQSFIA